jgi:hypothetical protein
LRILTPAHRLDDVPQASVISPQGIAPRDEVFANQMRLGDRNASEPPPRR